MKRYHAYHSGDPHKIGLWEDAEGHWVQHSDALAAIEAAEMRGYKQAIRHAIVEVEFQAEDQGWVDSREMIGALEVLAEQQAKP